MKFDKKGQLCGQNFSCFSRDSSLKRSEFSRSSLLLFSSSLKKKGAMGEGVLMVYRLLLVSFIAFVILGISSVFYVQYIDVRDVEAKILTRNVVECISPNGTIDINSFSEEDKSNILSYCGFDESEVERFYVEIEVTDPKGSIKLSQGDSGALWVLSIFKNNRAVEGLKKYESGYYNETYPVAVIREGDTLKGIIKTKVLVKDEL